MSNALTRPAPVSPHAARDAARSSVALLRSLLLKLNSHDAYTYRHSLRTVRLSLMLAHACDFSRESLRVLCLGAVAHDLGKIFVPGSVLHKPGALTPEEWEAMRRHPRAGEQLLLAAVQDKQAARVVSEHHERWDGGGYPAGLKGEEIDACARVVTVADAFDAMTSARAYRPAMSYDAAAAELSRCAGTQFDPAPVRAFLAIPRAELEEITARRSASRVSRAGGPR